MTSAFRLQHTATALRLGRVIAYPTEAVYGLGCDPLNQQAVYQLLNLKHRSPERGLILIASEFEQLRPYIANIDQSVRQKALASWPGPNTWLFPAAASTPFWLTGRHNTIAVRITAHPVARAICETAGMAIVSTSCNIEKHRPARTALEAQIKCPRVDVILHGSVDRHARPSVIRDLMTGTILRS